MKKLKLLMGPCVIESKELCDLIAGNVSQICKDLDVDYVFKASYKKANRTSAKSFTGLDFKEAMSILDYVRNKYAIEVITDIHESQDADLVAPYVDYLQIPAFLFRQAALLEAAGKTGKKINIKKGQFAGPEAMKFAAEKIELTGNNQILLTERGVTFGYNDLVVDFTGIAKMKEFGYPVGLDATHCLQKPNQTSGVTAGKPEYVPLMFKLAAAAEVDFIFAEVHPEPHKSLSDKDTIFALDRVFDTLNDALKIRNALSK